MYQQKTEIKELEKSKDSLTVSNNSFKNTLKKIVCICKCCLCPRLKSLECCPSCEIVIQNSINPD